MEMPQKDYIFEEFACGKLRLVLAKVDWCEKCQQVAGPKCREHSNQPEYEKSAAA